MFGTWLAGISDDLKPLVLLGATASCWSIWLSRNAKFFENKQSFFFVGNLISYALASYMGYPSEFYIPEFGCSGITVLGVGGQGVFYLGTWMAI